MDSILFKYQFALAGFAAKEGRTIGTNAIIDEKSLSFNYTKRSPSGGFVIDVAKKKFSKVSWIINESIAWQLSDSFNNSERCNSSNFNLNPF